MERLKILESEVLRHKALYYQGTPEISDSEFDKLEDELRALDSENYALSVVGSAPTGSDKVSHDVKMLSLNKTYDKTDLKEWMKGHNVVSTFKLDGVSCSLIYENGYLAMAKTRGDGSVGENITLKVNWMSTVPKKIETEIPKVEIRGEIFCDEESFYNLSNEMQKIGLEKPTSQRNIVAGLISRKENLSLNRFIRFKGFEYIAIDPSVKTEVDKHMIIEKLGFETAEMTLHTDLSKIDEELSRTEKFMSEGEYQIDGLVLAYNEIDLQEELGNTAHHPRYKMAFKFKGETKVTTIKEISWQVSRNGILTPVAEIEVVELSGAKLSRVTLHNFGMVKNNQLKPGDKIEIIRSGEVIPKFLSVIESSSNEFTFPKACPSCSQEVEERDIRLICNNDLCPAKVKEGILNFIQKIGIDDLSTKRLEEMIRKGIVKDIPDLYKVTKEQLLSLDKTKDKLADKLIESIEKSKKVDFITFLSALGISGGAYNKCEKVVRSGINTVKEIRELTKEKLMNVESFAEKSASEFIKSLEEKSSLIEKLVEKGFVFEKGKDNSKNMLFQKKICITGSLSEKRSVIEAKIRDAGGIVVGSVSKNTDILLTNETEAKSSKYKKAQTLNISIKSEAEILELIN